MSKSSAASYVLIGCFCWESFWQILVTSFFIKNVRPRHRLWGFVDLELLEDFWEAASLWCNPIVVETFQYKLRCSSLEPHPFASKHEFGIICPILYDIQCTCFTLLAYCTTDSQQETHGTTSPSSALWILVLLFTGNLEWCSWWMSMKCFNSPINHIKSEFSFLSINIIGIKHQRSLQPFIWYHRKTYFWPFYWPQLHKIYTLCCVNVLFPSNNTNLSINMSCLDLDADID